MIFFIGLRESHHGVKLLVEFGVGHRFVTWAINEPMLRRFVTWAINGLVFVDEPSGHDVTAWTNIDRLTDMLQWAWVWSE